MSGPAAQRPAAEPVWWVGIRLLSLFVRVVTPLRIVGLENLPVSGPAVVVANHVSYLDPIVLVVVAHRRGRKMRFLGVREVFERPVVGRLLRIGRHIPVGYGPEAMLAIRQARAALARGDLVLIYPEGTIPGSAPVTAAKGGAGLLALSTGVPVVPIATRGLERRPGRSCRRRRVGVRVGPPVRLDGLGQLSGRRRYDAAAEEMLAAIRDLQGWPADCSRENVGAHRRVTCDDQGDDRSDVRPQAGTAPRRH